MVDQTKKSKSKKPALKDLPEVKILKRCQENHCKKQIKELKEVSKVVDKSLKACHKLYPSPKKCYGRSPTAKKECTQVVVKRLNCASKGRSLTASEKELMKSQSKRFMAFYNCQKEHCESEQTKLSLAMMKFFQKKYKTVKK